MSDKKTSGVPFAGEDAAEQRLWAALDDLPREMPSRELRRTFYERLDDASAPRWPERLLKRMGLGGKAGWLTAAASLVVGLVVGLQLQGPGEAERMRFAALEQQVAMLNRNLILDRLADTSAGKRLSGVLEAGEVAGRDSVIAHALLELATGDSVYSVRTAAIDALGPQLTAPTVGDELMGMLEAAESPLVQLALVDLVLRHGSAAQLERLIELAERGLLHPDLVQHVQSSVRRT